MEDKTFNALEEGRELQLDFSKISKVAQACRDVIPVAVQDITTKEVILIAYTNREALELTVKTGIVTFWSTSRNEFWIKGKTSGNTYAIRNIFVNCEQNSLVYQVQAKAQGICHTSNKAGKARNCYYRKLNFSDLSLENLDP